MARLALLIGSSQYDDPKLAQLKLPETDVARLSEVLSDPEIGHFDEVTPLLNGRFFEVQRAIVHFFAGKKRDDLLLLYFAGHGVRDDEGHLYLALRDSELAHDLIRATAVPAAVVTREMDRCRSQQQILILDCCHSGAFARGARSATGARVGTATTFEGTGRGRVVLTATDETQYAFEGDEVTGAAESSVFTRHLIAGLATGAADVNHSGTITIDELYDYVHARVLEETPKQTPGKWTYKQQGDIVVARSPRRLVVPAELPAELRAALESGHSFQMVGAITELEAMLAGADPGLALTAGAWLERLAGEDSRRVSDAAHKALARMQTEKAAPPETVESVPETVASAGSAPEPAFAETVARSDAAATVESITTLIPPERATQRRTTHEPTPARHAAGKAGTVPVVAGTAYQRLAALLQAGDWKNADLETRSVICTAIGKGSRSGLCEAEVAEFPCRVLRELDALWTSHSGGRFGFTVQARRLRECGGDPNRFATEIGWIHEGLWIFYADVRFAADAPPGHLPVGGPAGLLADSSYAIAFKAPIENIKSQWLDHNRRFLPGQSVRSGKPTACRGSFGAGWVEMGGGWRGRWADCGRRRRRSTLRFPRWDGLRRRPLGPAPRGGRR